VRGHLAHASRRHRQVGGHGAQVDQPPPPLARARRQLPVVGEERVEPGPHVEPAIERCEQHGAPRLGQAPAHGRDADQERVGPVGQGLVQRRDDRDVAAHAEHGPGGRAGGLRVDQRGHRCGRVAQERNRGLRVEHAERPLDQHGEAPRAAIGREDRAGHTSSR
jgi:hypothetical protein